MQRAVVISLAVGTGALVVSLVMILIAVPLLGDTFQKTMFVNSVVGCYSIGSPVTYYCLRQADRLRAANRELERLHRELAAANSDLWNKVRIDEMTGLLNRSYFLEAFKQHGQQEQAKNPAEDKTKEGVGSFLIIDADQFKQINDRWGHQCGDVALLKITSAIKGAVRESDLVGRIGGEEFAVFLPGADQSCAMEVAERIRSAVEQLSFRPRSNEPVHPLSVSIGGVSSREQSSPSLVIAAADANMYKAKNAGRNRVVFSAPRAIAA